MSQNRKIKKRQRTKQQKLAEPSGEQAQILSEGRGNPAKLPVIVLFLFGFFLYAQTFTYEIALDDKLVITLNQFTVKGFAGMSDIFSNDMLVGFYGKKKNLLAGGRYRPLSQAMFAMEAQLFGKLKKDGQGKPVLDQDGDKVYEYNPFIGHFLNTVFYGLTGVVLFLILFKLFPPEQKKWFLTFPFIATVLYLAHPLHTEVVANIKGRDEILSLLGALVTLYFILRYMDDKKTKFLAYGVTAFLLALLSKESAITFLVIIPLTIYYFTKHPLTANIRAMIPVAIITAIYLGIRYAVVGGMNNDPVPELMNDPFLHASGGEKMATIFFTLGLYLKLLFFPHPLTHDYYPWHPVADGNYIWGQAFPYISWSHPVALFSLIAFIFIGIMALRGIKKKTFLSYCLIFFLVTFALYTNFVFSIGTFMNERFLYVPSIGLCMLLAYWLTVTLKEKMQTAHAYKNILMLLLGILLTGYTAKTLTRNTAWENDFTLSSTDAQISRNSAKANMSAGGSITDEAKKQSDQQVKNQMLATAVAHLHRALELYPTYTQAMVLLGNAYFLKQEYASSLHYFQKCIDINATSSTGTLSLQNLHALGNACTQTGNHEDAVNTYKALIKYEPQNASVYAKLGEVYGKNLGNLDQAIHYIGKANELNPDNPDIMQKLGVAHAMNGDAQKAIDVFHRVLELNPKNAHVMMNLGVAYKNSGRPEQGEGYLNRAFEMDPSLKR